MLISFADTHAYPGYRLALHIDRGPTEPDAVADISDGCMVGARIVGDKDDRLDVTIDAYRTAKGTDIPSKDWVLRKSVGGWIVARRT